MAQTSAKTFGMMQGVEWPGKITSRPQVVFRVETAVNKSMTVAASKVTFLVIEVFACLCSKVEITENYDEERANKDSFSLVTIFLLFVSLISANSYVSVIFSANSYVFSANNYGLPSAPFFGLIILFFLVLFSLFVLSCLVLSFCMQFVCSLISYYLCLLDVDS